MAANSRKPQSTGVGESKPHIAPEGSFEPGTIDWSALTLNGQPIPEHLHGLLPYEMTDQGCEEKNAGKEPSRVQFLSDEVDKKVQRYRDDLSGDRPFEEVHDPLAIAMKENLPRGHRGLFMSEQKCSRDGMRRGVLDYEPVLVEKDGKLERVKVGSMFLGSVPEERARQAERYYEEKTATLTQAATDKVREQSNAIASEAKLKRLDNKRGGAMDFGGITREEDGEVIGEIPHEYLG